MREVKSFIKVFAIVACYSKIVMKHAFISFNLKDGWTDRWQTKRWMHKCKDRWMKELNKNWTWRKKHFHLQVLSAGHCSNKTQRLSGWFGVQWIQVSHINKHTCDIQMIASHHTRENSNHIYTILYTYW